MSEQQLCPQCGSEIPAGAPAGLCPKCLVLAGLESRPADNPQTAATQPPPSPSAAGFLPPAIEELAARFPQLEILELLGRGGMGAVYKARQRELDRLVAVKILPPEVGRDPAFAERFTREARAMARLSHPNIVAVYDFGKLPSPPAPLPQGEGRPEPLFYFIMEYVDGVNLRQAIQTGGMDPKQALAIVPQICDALQFAHDEGVVHRDIKPENILIDKRGRVKIADFGLAKLLGQEAADHGLTATQQVMGTLRYMAPEQMEGTKTVDHRADIYSLGVVFYELLTGELPIGRFAPPSKMVEIDVRLDEVVLRALEKKPEQRYQQASEVKTDMEQIRSGPAATKGSVAAGAAANDRGFVAVLVTGLAVAWAALLFATDGDKLPFGLPYHPPLIVGIHLLFPPAVALLAGLLFWLGWRRPIESFLDRLSRPAPMLVGCHLLVFTIALFCSGYDRLAWDRVMFETPEWTSTASDMAKRYNFSFLTKTTDAAYVVGPWWNTWVSPLVATVASLGLFAVLLTAGSPRRARARSTILILVGLVAVGAVLEYLALRPPEVRTFTRDEYRAFAPEHAGRLSDFIRRADSDFDNQVASWEHAPFRGVPFDPARVFGELKTEQSRVSVRHYYQDEIAWFFLPGGLLLLCGALTWRLAPAQEASASLAPRLAPLAVIGAFVGIAGPLVCVPGMIVAFLMLDKKEYLWGSAPSISFMIGLVGMLVWTGISLLAMSVLGAAAIGQIRHSGGRFYGLHLALLEALFCPAIALYCAAFGVLAMVLAALPRPKNAGMALSPVLFAGFVIVIVAIAFIYWRLLKRLRTSPKEPGAVEEDKPRVVVAALPSASNQSSAIGKISLWTSISGLVAPLLLALIGSLVAKALNISDAYYTLCLALWIVLEFVAFGCGIVVRRTAAGKVGLVVSSISFALAGLVFALASGRFEAKSVPLRREVDDKLTTHSAATDEQTSESSTPGSPSVPNPFGLHPGKQVPPTPAELVRVLDELPKEFTKGLLGSVPATVSELDTQIFAIDFDDGPADFWLQVRETGQQTFPVRLPSRNETESWRIPKAKAHILMWIQPRQSVGMSDRLRGTLAKTPPGCSLGIDVDGKAVARINYDTPVGGVNQAVPNPLWSGWASKEMHHGDGGFDAEMASQALLYIGRKSMAQGSTTSCQLGLMYRPDRIRNKVATDIVTKPLSLHPGKQVPPTPKELAHILAELPKDLTKGLQGSDEQRILDLDTRVFAIDFDDGPAEFWLQVKETGQHTFPDRLPTPNTGGAWRIPTSKAHILMWIQPRYSDSMSAQRREALRGMPPGFSLGIDVDGKSATRINYDVPTGQWANNPLFSGEYEEMHARDFGFDAEMASKAMLYLGRVSRAHPLLSSCQLGLMYRPDRDVKKDAR